ncbi:MAG: hypothetical protein EBW90_09065, partial [Rhodobacteraceae bacterium]|nr:hypothetical protein [Rhodobacterales bacterium]NCX58540.1 hypothetical protein [Paracoccaceae bacterium]
AHHVIDLSSICDIGKAGQNLWMVQVSLIKVQDFIASSQQIVDTVFSCLTAAACKQYTHAFVPQNTFGPNLVDDDPNAMVNLHPATWSI